MKKLISLLLVLCLSLTVFVACTRDKDRAENNGKVTDDTEAVSTKDTEDDMDTSDTGDSLIDDAGDAVSDAAEGVTDAVDDILGGSDTSSDTDTAVTSDGTDTTDNGGRVS